MTREEAHALAEREVLEYARAGHLKRLADKKGVSMTMFGASTLCGAAMGIRAQLQVGHIDTGDIASLAALCIEFLRECHVEHYNNPPGSA
jgi:hypothetical protein